MIIYHDRSRIKRTETVSACCWRIYFAHAYNNYMHRAKRERLYLKKVEAECLEKGLPMPVPQGEGGEGGEGEGGGAGLLYPLQFRNHPQACSEYPVDRGQGQYYRLT
eukprot:COSAG06_NODE_3099_length_5861_cov_5.328879_2_plen_107_part_00